MSIESDLAVVATQEKSLRFERFEESTAWRLGNRLRDIAQVRNLPVVIDIRRFGQPLFYCALAGSVPDNAEWARRKGSSLETEFGLPTADYAAHGGAFPLIVHGAGVIGAVTVSGLPQRMDHELVVEVLAQELGRDHASLQLPAED